jgi:hypothetical protein
MYIDIEKTFAEVIRIASTSYPLGSDIMIAEQDIKKAMEKFDGLQKSCDMCLDLLETARSSAK